MVPAKTTTMQMLTGNLAPSTGSVTICGVDLLERPASAKARIGYLPEVPPLYKELTVDEYLWFAARIHRVPSKQAKEAVTRAKRRCGVRCSGRQADRPPCRRAISSAWASHRRSSTSPMSSFSTSRPWAGPDSDPRESEP
jgi:ABC-type glutathione transport system ATPase component